MIMIDSVLYEPIHLDIKRHQLISHLCDTNCIMNRVAPPSRFASIISWILTLIFGSLAFERSERSLPRLLDLAI